MYRARSAILHALSVARIALLAAMLSRAGLASTTPNEIDFERLPAHHRPRFEPRAGWPREERCAIASRLSLARGAGLSPYRPVARRFIMAQGPGSRCDPAPEQTTAAHAASRSTDCPRRIISADSGPPHRFACGSRHAEEISSCRAPAVASRSPPSLPSCFPSPRGGRTGVRRKGPRPAEAQGRDPLPRRGHRDDAGESRNAEGRGVPLCRPLDVPLREFSEGFPGITDRFEWFGLLYKGTFQVSTAGLYGWELISDDGSRLWIDGREVIDNDGIHGMNEVAGEIQLAKGPHEIKVWFFQGPATELGLQLFVTPPGEEEQIFDMQNFSAGLAAALGRVKAEATADGIRVHMDAQVMFDTGKSTLKPSAQATITDVAKVITSYPGSLVRVEGYTDAQGDDASNQKLSVDRAEAVRAALAGAAAGGDVRYETQGFGELRPIASNDTETGRARNRRVEITIVPK